MLICLLSLSSNAWRVNTGHKPCYEEYLELRCLNLWTFHRWVLRSAHDENRKGGRSMLNASQSQDEALINRTLLKVLFRKMYLSIFWNPLIQLLSFPVCSCSSNTLPTTENAEQLMSMRMQCFDLHIQLPLCIYSPYFSCEVSAEWCLQKGDDILCIAMLCPGFCAGFIVAVWFSWVGIEGSVTTPSRKSSSSLCWASYLVARPDVCMICSLSLIIWLGWFEKLDGAWTRPSS